MDIFRGRYRESFETSDSDPANTPLTYKFDLPTANHVFLPGHRIMVQVQSTLVSALRPQPADVRAEHLLREAGGLREGNAARLSFAGTSEFHRTSRRAAVEEIIGLVQRKVVTDVQELSDCAGCGGRTDVDGFGARRRVGGGWRVEGDRRRQLKTVQYSATGMRLRARPGAEPEARPGRSSSNKSYTRSINFEAPASKVDRVRVQGENPPRGGGQQPIVGEQPQTQTIIVAADTPWAQQLEIWMMPHGFLRAAAAQERDRRGEDGRRQEVQRRELRRRQQGQGQRLHQRRRIRSSASRPGSTTHFSATCCSRRPTATTRTSAAPSSRCTSCRSRAAIRCST